MRSAQLESPITHLAINGRFLVQHVTGVQRVAHEFTRALDDLLVSGEFPDLRVTILAPARGELTVPVSYRALKIERGGRLRGHLWEQIELPRLTRGAPLLCLGNVAPIRMLSGTRPPVFTMVHDLSHIYFPAAYGWRYRRLYGILTPRVLKGSRLIFTVSESERAAITSAYPDIPLASRLVAVQNGGGVEGGAFAVSDGSSSLRVGAKEVPSRSLRDPLAVYVGSITERKNARGLIKAAEQLVAEEDLRFVFVGGSARSFESVDVDAISPDRRDRIEFLGQINEADRIEEILRRAMVFVFPSFYEASPLPPTEAMTFGCPVVVSDIPSLRERCGDAAEYCDPSDVDSIVNAARMVLRDPSRWASLQTAGLDRAAEFSWRGQAREIVSRILGSLPETATKGA